MASSFSSPGPNGVGKFTMTSEDLKAFHTIDRGLYARLVLDLGRDLNESMHALAFWLWLERANVTTVYVVQEMLVLPDPIINMLAEEAALCLKSITAEPLHFPVRGFPNDQIPLTQNLTRTNLTLNFLHASRDAAIPGITRTIEDVCLRVVDDIVQRAAQVVAAKERDDYHQQQGQYLFTSTSTNINNIRAGGGRQQVQPPFSYFSPPPSTGGATTRVEEQAFKSETGSVLGRLRIIDERYRVGDGVAGQENNEGVDDRTIFLTFSRGYPIREDEVRDFFTRKFGDCIESIQMQDVPAGEQPLYARLVLRSVGAMKVILEGKEKAKFAINGKHVWARKYVFNKNAAGPSNLYWSPPGGASCSSSPSLSNSASPSKLPYQSSLNHT